MPAGLLSHVGVGKEVTWGTPVAATDYIALLSESITHNIEQVMEPEIRANLGEAPQYEGLTSVNGDIVFLARPVGLGFFLRSLLGAPNTSGAGPYTHVFLPSATDFSTICALPPYTFEVNRQLSQAFQFAGCVVNELSLEFGVSKKLLTATASLLGKSVATIAATVPSLEAASPFKWLQPDITIGGVAITDIESMTIKISNNLQGVESLNKTKLLARLLRNDFVVVDITLQFGVYDLTEYTRFTSQGEATFAVDFNPDANTELKIETNKLRYTGFPLGTSGPGRYTVGIAAKAKYDSALGGPIKLTLKNSKSSY